MESKAIFLELNLSLGDVGGSRQDDKQLFRASCSIHAEQIKYHKSLDSLLKETIMEAMSYLSVRFKDELKSIEEKIINENI
jgi:hypothetical protein